MTPSEQSPRRLTDLLVPIAISALIVWGLQHFLDWRQIGESLSRINGTWLLCAVCAGVLVLVARACRLVAILNLAPTGNCIGVLQLTTRHHAIFSILPSGAGDLFFAPLARLHLGQSMPAALASLGLMRLSDVFVLMLLGMLAASLSLQLGHADVVLVLLGLGALIGCMYRLDAIVGLLARIVGLALSRRPFVNYSWTTRIAAALDSSARWADRHAIRKAMRIANCWTLVSWLATVVMVWSLLCADGRAFDLAQATLIVVMLNAAGAIAVFSLAGLGVVDVTLFGMLAAFGLAPADAASTAAVVRVILISLNLCLPAVAELGYLAFAKRWYAARRKA